jgi:C-terminal processing protease CtpA/Prc
MTIDRKGKTLVFPVTLKNRQGNLETIKRETKDAISSLGVDLEDVDSKVLRKLDLENGVQVKSLERGKIEKYTDMRAGFIITRIDNIAVKSAKEAIKTLSKKKTGDLITFEGVYPDYPREYIYALRM